VRRVDLRLVSLQTYELSTIRGSISSTAGSDLVLQFGNARVVLGMPLIELLEVRQHRLGRQWRRTRLGC
jgi:hypothetical protein